MENGLKQEIREEIIKVAQKNNVGKVILFGYRARGRCGQKNAKYIERFMALYKRRVTLSRKKY